MHSPLIRTRISVKAGSSFVPPAVASSFLRDSGYKRFISLAPASSNFRFRFVRANQSDSAIQQSWIAVNEKNLE
ncbi:hypothetical protein TNCV_218431 [Trichonephila clavipes]|uniref:Uncharacterized protein n=1 Tax=Trichonephila clavipes TaxID=2585209 RepID=A0A8X6S453_TRICX|nr:hypothetical protein TNCV_218431 [Trichonephila clavipes]